jgi:hypothetical protein
MKFGFCGGPDPDFRVMDFIRYIFILDDQRAAIISNEINKAG